MNEKLNDTTYWVGCVDWNVRDFHGYETGRGSTYNSYLIQDEKNVLIDTVKAPFAHELIQQIGKHVDPAKLDYIVCNHAEPDHSSALPELLKQIPGATVICNKKCKDTLSKHYKTASWKFKIVEDGGTFSIGKRTLMFINTPMVHWPESMFTYVPEDKILFSMDAFGQHYATTGRFDDEEPLDITLHEAKMYYANIVMLYGNPIAKVLGKASALDIQTIAPSHGLIWRSHINKILEAYINWVSFKPEPRILVLYDTMWKSTEKMAKAILEGAQTSMDAKLLFIRANNLTQLATEILDAAGVAFGSPTLNKTLMPEMAALLTYLKGLGPKNKLGFAFGSYGWSKGGPQAVHGYLQEIGLEIIRDPIQTEYVPTPQVLDTCKEAGKNLADLAWNLINSHNNKEIK